MEEKTKKIREQVQASQKNYGSNLKAIEQILMNERGYIFEKPVGKDVVVLYSGGLDSTVMIDVIIKEWDSVVYPLYITRGARSQKFEEEAFDFFVKFYKEKYPDSMGTPKKMKFDIPPHELKEDIPKERLLTIGHPMRNSTMQNLAVMYAVSLESSGRDIKTILTGSVREDTTEPELGLLSLRAQTLNTCINTGDWRWQISSPLTEQTLPGRPLDKVDLIKHAIENNIPLEKTRTCFSADEIADGVCIGCQKRLNAFRYLEMQDRIPYRVIK